MDQVLPIANFWLCKNYFFQSVTIFMNQEVLFTWQDNCTVILIPAMDINTYDFFFNDILKLNNNKN